MRVAAESPTRQGKLSVSRCPGCLLIVRLCGAVTFAVCARFYGDLVDVFALLRCARSRCRTSESAASIAGFTARLSPVIWED